ALRDGYPLGPYTEFAEIKIADTHFFLRNYADAAPYYEQLLQNRSSSQSAAYLTLQAGRSYHLSNKGLGRDASALEKALTFYERVVEQFPRSLYAEAARAHIVEV